MFQAICFFKTSSINIYGPASYFKEKLLLSTTGTINIDSNLTTDGELWIWVDSLCHNAGHLSIQSPVTVDNKNVWIHGGSIDIQADIDVGNDIILNSKFENVYTFL